MGESINWSNLVVTTVLADPYVMKRAGGGYRGFLVDILDTIAGMEKFNYTIIPNLEGQYGTIHPDGTTTGMIEDLLQNKADIAMGDLTITSPRMSKVDFTMPYLSQSISLLLKRRARPDPDGPVFLLTPFSWEVWVSIIGTVILVSLLFMLIYRVGLFEWPYKEPRASRHAFEIRGSLMFIFNSLFLQGYPNTPRSLPGRILAFSWGFFVLIATLVYAANLVVLMLVPANVSFLYNTIDDVIESSRINIGAIRGGSTYHRFRTSKIPAQHRIWEKMSEESLVNNAKEGIRRVTESDQKYGMMLESLAAEYVIHRHCDLRSIDVGHFKMHLGFATRKYSHIVSNLNRGILKLLEDQSLATLQRKWWEDRGFCSVPHTPRLNFYGVTVQFGRISLAFVIIVTGVIASVVMLVGEIIFKRYWIQ